MHMTVFNQLVITPTPISQKGNLVGDWTLLKKKNLKKSLTNNSQNNVVGKETYQKAKYYNQLMITQNPTVSIF